MAKHYLVGFQVACHGANPQNPRVETTSSARFVTCDRCIRYMTPEDRAAALEAREDARQLALAAEGRLEKDGCLRRDAPPTPGKTCAWRQENDPASMPVGGACAFCATRGLGTEDKKAYWLARARGRKLGAAPQAPAKVEHPPTRPSAERPNVGSHCLDESRLCLVEHERDACDCDCDNCKETRHRGWSDAFEEAVRAAGPADPKDPLGVRREVAAHRRAENTRKVLAVKARLEDARRPKPGEKGWLAAGPGRVDVGVTLEIRVYPLRGSIFFSSETIMPTIHGKVVKRALLRAAKSLLDRDIETTMTIEPDPQVEPGRTTAMLHGPRGDEKALRRAARAAAKSLGKLGVKVTVR